MKDIIIRAATESDFKFVQKLQIDANLIDICTNSVESIECLKEYSEKGIFLIAEKQNVIIGFILGQLLLTKGSLLMYWVVAPEYRNKGIGTILLKRFKTIAKTMGAEWILSNVVDRGIMYHKRNNAVIGKKYTEILYNL